MKRQSIILLFCYLVMLLGSGLFGTTAHAVTPQIAAGDNHTVELMSNGTVKAWGYNDYGQLGNSGTYTNPTPTPVTGLTGVVAISAGYAHTVALLSGGTVKAWGANYFGQLGKSTNDTTNPTPTAIAGLSGVVAISAGGAHTVALLSDGTVKAWGNNFYGQLGNSSDTTVKVNPKPTTVAGLTGVVAISTGVGHTVALLNDGTVKAWGDNYFGQLGSSTNNGVYNSANPTPTVVAGLVGVVAIAAGRYHTVALLNDGTVKAWGNNQYGQLGNSTNNGSPNTANPTPTEVAGLTGVVAIEAGYEHTVALLSDGTVKAWGNNHYSQLGNSTNTGTYTANSTPTTVAGLTGVVAIAAGTSHTVALLNDVTVKAWGSNSAGQLGNTANYGTGTANPTPTTVVAEFVGVISIETGFRHTVVLMSDNTVMAWGLNNDGELGSSTNTGTSTPISTPTAVAGLTGVVAIAAGYDHTVALLHDGTVKAWGNNFYGQLGISTNNGTNTPNSIPTTVAGLSGVVAIAAGKRYTVALLSDGTVKAWGLNYSGQLGYSTNIGTGNPNPTPTTVTGLTGVVAIATGGYSDHTVALLSDGTVKAWGLNYSGQLGYSTNIGTVTPNPTPTAVAGLTEVVAISAGSDYTVALLSDSTVKAWGDNTYGSLGAGTVTPNPTPTAVAGLTGVIAIAAGGSDHTVALLSDGTVKAWGYNKVGQLGNSTNTGTSNANPPPTPVTGLTGVVAISAGYDYTVALLSGGTVKAWGGNAYGQLGNSTNLGTMAANPTPAMVAGLTRIITPSAGTNGNISPVTPWTVLPGGSATFTITPASGYGAASIDGTCPLGSFLPTAGTINYTTGAVTTDCTVIATFARAYTVSTMVSGTGGTVICSPASVVSGGSSGCTITPASGYQLATFTDNSISMMSQAANNSYAITTITANHTIQATFKLNGTCGGANSVAVSSIPTTNLCSFGTATSVAGNGPWNWNCSGSNNGSTASCSANLKENGTCGSANGTASKTAPTGNFCTTGTATTVSGSGPWNWTCSGTNGGTTAICSNPLLVNSATKLTISAPSNLDLNNSLMVTGLLSLVSSGAPSSLSGQSITITVTLPGGNSQTMPPATTDETGAWTQTLNNVFITPGTYYINASFNGTNTLLTSNTSSAPANILVNVSAGYAIIIQGKDSNADGYLDHQFTATRVKASLKERGLQESNILSYSSDTITTPTKAQIQSAITSTLAKMQVSPAPFYLIFVGHGDRSKFYLGADTSDSTIIPSDIDNWLTTIEAGLSASALALAPRVVVIGSCYSGSFIPTLSNTGRIIITSAAASEQSIRGATVGSDPTQGSTHQGDLFVDELFAQLARGTTIRDAFLNARDAAKVRDNRAPLLQAYHSGVWDTLNQHPLLDDNGNGTGSYDLTQASEGQLAATVLLGTGNPGSHQADIISVTPTQFLSSSQTSVNLGLTPLSTTAVGSAWIEINAPGTSSTSGGIGQVPLATTVVTLNQGTWSTTYANFTTPGTYTIFYYTKDSPSGDISPLVSSVVYKNGPTVSQTAPAPFSVISPTGIYGSSFLPFSWQASSSKNTPLTYTLQVCLDSNCSSTPIFSKERITGNSYIMPSGTIPQGSYYWQVIAYDSNGNPRTSTNRPALTITTSNNALPAVLSGTVANSSTPLGNVTVTATATGSNYSGTTLNNGTYLIFVEAGTYTIAVSVTGDQQSQTVSAASGTIVTTNFTMNTASQYNVTGSFDNNGSISCTSPVVSGTTTACSVTPNSGYQIGTASGCSGTLSGTTYTTGAIAADCTVTASFITAAIPVNGVCGSSSSGTFTIAPTANFCSSGTASSVTGSGPWSWSCAGSNGGSTAQCSTTSSNASTGNRGDLNGDSKVDISDALRALQIAVHHLQPSASELARGDVGPLVNGIATPDGKIDISDAVLILEKSVGVGSW